MTMIDHDTGLISQTQKILIVGPSWVGDMVMSQSLFSILKQLDPNVSIDVLAPAWSKPLLDAMPEVDQALQLPIGHGQVDLGLRRRLGRQLQQAGYHRAILLPNSWKSALIPWFAKIPIRSGWRGEMRYGLLNDFTVLDKQAYPLMVQQFAVLAWPANQRRPLAKAAIPKPSLLIDGDQQKAVRLKFAIVDDRPLLALCPGAEFGVAKRWPPEYYAAVATERINNGDAVFIFGSDSDKAVGERILAMMPESLRSHCKNLAGRTTLAEAINALSLMDTVISNDSGLMHIAAALAKPLVAIYGSTSPEFTPPLGETVSVVSLEVDCGPCFKRECPLGHHKCLQDLKPHKVLGALNDVVEQIISATKS